MLIGTNFADGQTTVTVSGKDVRVDHVVVVSSGLLTARFDIKKKAKAGPRSVTVTTADGTSNAVTFTVTSRR
jgi:hypothetical protein